MPHQTEPSVNAALGNVLQGMLPTCQVRSENTQIVIDAPRLQLDILITAAGRSPVVIEAEYDPAGNVEREAKGRLDKRVVGEQRPIEAAIALKYPEWIGDSPDLYDAITIAPMKYCVFSQDALRVERFPQSGWLTGNTGDLADMVRLISVSRRAAEEAAIKLEQGIDLAVAVLNRFEASRPRVLENMAKLLGMSNVLQTRRMACAIIANAMVFHEQLVGIDDVKPLAQIFDRTDADPQSGILEAWSNILEINYWSIFAIAKSIVEQLPARDAAEILRTLRRAAGDVIGAGIDNAHDLTGMIFQRLIADRKYLATFYTRPASAALLARLAVAKMKNVNWADADRIGNLKIGDFACGTGALLSAVYEQIASRHERSGGNTKALHPVMMERVLYGCDVMPSATHITGSTLSGMEPTVQYRTTRLYTLPYGRQRNGGVRVGSLELLNSSSTHTLIDTSESATRVGVLRDEPAQYIAVDMPDNGFDMVIMNPPFTNATNHEGAHADITNPAFAAFGASRADQTEMGKRANALSKDSCYHGNAGIASAFAALANRKLKPGGVLALVLPLSVATGLSWQKFRRMLADEYTDVELVSIASTGKSMSFSADTGMAECLVLARKEKTTSSRVKYINLNRQPQIIMHGHLIAHAVNTIFDPRGVGDGPFGGSRLEIGDELIGEIMAGEADESTLEWNAVRLVDQSLAQTAHALCQSKLWLPQTSGPVHLKTALLSEVGSLGLVHRDINGPTPRGPFDKAAPARNASFPALWNHTATNEKNLLCVPDSQLIVRQGMEAKAIPTWAKASRTHLNQEFTFGSQALAAALTAEPTLGGSAWPNVILPDRSTELAYVLWLNCTLGMVLYWWKSGRQQSAKARLTRRSAEYLTVLDFRALSESQLLVSDAIFDEMRDKELKPAYLADADPNRALLDRRVICDLLEFDEDVYIAVRRLAAKWCAEPSVHGGKKRPRGSQLVM